MKRATVSAILKLVAASGLVALVCSWSVGPAIQSALRDDAVRQVRSVSGLEELTVEVIDGRNVVLMGRVSNSELAERAVGIASRIGGVRRVISQFDVGFAPVTPTEQDATPRKGRPYRGRETTSETSLGSPEGGIVPLRSDASVPRPEGNGNETGSARGALLAQPDDGAVPRRR